MQKKQQLTIATYNIQFGFNKEKIIANIYDMAQNGVSIFCLQEIINVANEEFIIDQLIKKLGNNWKAAYHVGEEFSKLSIGTAILFDTNKVRLKHQKKILLPKLKRFDPHEHLYYRVVGVPGVPLQRKTITCDFSLGQTTIRVSSVHADNTGGPRHRIKQIAYLMTKLNELDTLEHEIICGDFNTFDLLKTGYEKKSLQKIIGSVFIDASAGIDWTSDIHMIDFRTSIKFFPWFINYFNVHIRKRLDYIWVKNFTIQECKKLEIRGSDHFPIVAKLMLSND